MADHTDAPGDADSATSAVSPLVILARRWQLVVVGLIAGAFLGVLIQLSSTRLYQSNAQVLVVKKRADLANSANSTERGGGAVVDDYVGAQITIIKSELVRRMAAAELRKMQVTTELPENDGLLADQIGVGLSVARDRESATPGTIGNGIVVISMKGTNPADTKTYLDAVVRAYQGVLKGVYDVASKEQIDLSKKAIESDLVKLTQLGEEKIRLENEKNRVTTEDLSGVRARVSSQKDTLYKDELELVKVRGNLKLIESAGQNQRDRQAVLARLTGTIKSGLRNADQGIERQLNAKKLERAVRLEKLGVAHPEIRQLDREIQFLADEIARLNPTDPGGVLDELGAVGKELEQQQFILTEQIKQLEKRLRDDQATLVSVGEVTSKLGTTEGGIKLVTDDIAKLEQQVRNAEVASGAGGYEANAVTPPSFGYQVAPKLAQSIMLGLAAGMALSGAAVAVAELSDRSFRSPAEIRRVLGVPVIGHIPRIKGLDAEPNSPEGMRGSLVTTLRPKSTEAEAYRGVRTQLYFSTQGRGHQVIQVTSPNPGDGKSTLAANLAVTIAQSGKRVVLMDCDFRKPQVHKIFGLEPKGRPKIEVGLASVVSGEASLARALRRSPVENLDLIPCGPRPDNPAELLTHPRFQQVLADLRDQYDFVIVDTPPMLAVTDPGAVAPRVDGVIMVFKMSKSARPAAQQTREQLAALGANVLGVVVNNSEGAGKGYGGYNYGLNYGYKYAAYEYAEGYTEVDPDAPTLPARK